MAGKTSSKLQLSVHLPCHHCIVSCREEAERCWPTRRPKCPGYWDFSVGKGKDLLKTI